MKWVGTGGNALYTFELGDDGTLSQVSGCVALFALPILAYDWQADMRVRPTERPNGCACMERWRWW
jgi:hypothetical protein